MNTTEQKMYDFLVDLKEKHHMVGIKISFEDEGLTGELAQIICSIAFKAGVPVSMKVGGCEAKRDMHDAKVLGADKIVVPMIETPYALKKFIEAVQRVYDMDELTNTKLLINVETITGYQNLKEILSRPEAQKLYGIVLGRVDLCGSMDQDRSFIMSPEIKKITLDMAQIAKDHDKKFFVGGGIAPDSMDFFHTMPENSLCCFETRNVVFDAATSLNDPNIAHALAKAQGFELAWMKRKKEFYERLANLEVKRIEMITERYNQTIAHLKEENMG